MNFSICRQKQNLVLNFFRIFIDYYQNLNIKNRTLVKKKIVL